MQSYLPPTTHAVTFATHSSCRHIFHPSSDRHICLPQLMQSQLLPTVHVVTFATPAHAITFATHAYAVTFATQLMQSHLPPSSCSHICRTQLMLSHLPPTANAVTYATPAHAVTFATPSHVDTFGTQLMQSNLLTTANVKENRPQTHLLMKLTTLYQSIIFVPSSVDTIFSFVTCTSSNRTNRAKQTV